MRSRVTEDFPAEFRKVVAFQDDQVARFVIPEDLGARAHFSLQVNAAFEGEDRLFSLFDESPFASSTVPGVLTFLHEAAGHPKFQRRHVFEFVPNAEEEYSRCLIYVLLNEFRAFLVQDRSGATWFFFSHDEYFTFSTEQGDLETEIQEFVANLN